MSNKIFIPVILGVAAIIAVLALAGVFNGSKQSADDSLMQKESEIIEKDEQLNDSGEIMENNEGNETKNESDKMIKAGSYQDYSEVIVSAEQQAGNKVVLFFHAAWCPFCKAADKAFKEKLSEIPDGVTVLKIDYDSSTELKQKYGVTYQHTFVQIDNQMNLVSKWNGGDVDNLIKYLK